MANERILIDNDSLIDMGDAIREKNGTATTYKPSEMPEAIRNLGAGNIVNGIIEQYKAKTGTISVDTFVEFVNGVSIESGTDASLSTITYSTYDARAVKIDIDKVFIAHRGSSSYLSGIVCTISGKEITKGTDTVLVNVSNSYNDASVVQIDTNKVFIAHKGSGLNGIVCTISGTTIAAGTDTNLVSTSTSYSEASATLIDENKVFIAHCGGGGAYLDGIVCTISGTTIIPGTNTSVLNKNYCYYNTSAVQIDTNKVFIAHCSDVTYRYLEGIVCTISGTTITVGVNKSLSSTENGTSYYTSAVQIDTNKVFIAYSSNKTDYYLKGMICTISGTTIAVNKDAVLSSETNSSYYASAVLMDKHKVFIAHRSDGVNDYLNGMVCDIAGTTITPGLDTVLVNIAGSYNYASATSIDTNKIFIAHQKDSSSNRYLNGVVCGTEKVVIPSVAKVEGLTKTQCTTLTAGDVWLLNTNN